MIFTNQLKLRVTVTKAEPSGLRTNGPAPCFVFLPTVSPTIISSQRVEKVCEANMSGASHKVNQVHDPAVCYTQRPTRFAGKTSQGQKRF